MFLITENPTYKTNKKAKAKGMLAIAINHNGIVNVIFISYLSCVNCIS